MDTPSLAWPVRLLRGGLGLAGRLPLPFLHAAGALLGAVLWLLHARPRQVAERNLLLVSTQDEGKTRHALARAALIETGKALAETAKIWGNPPGRALALVQETMGAELLDEALASGRGVIIAAPHLGCWELLNYWLAARTPLAILYRAPRTSTLEPLLRQVRGALPVEQVRAEGSGVRALYRRLAAGGAIGILPDQKPRQGEGVPAPLFGVPASTMVLLPRLAQRTGARVLFAFAERLPRGRGYRIHVLPAPEGLCDADPVIACTALNRGVEACVQRAFTQYQWTYKRWPKDAHPPDAGP
ncbi:MAG: lipid A biosynthesis acyltransferase [Xanthomonadales bacterium]|nr:lipid A biosynthesis acyltransferase [Xanthomonadales bacterium]